MTELQESPSQQILQSIDNDDVQTLTHLLASNKQLLDTLDDNENNLLHHAITKNRYETFKYLLSLDHFNLETKNSYYLTPLYQALKNADSDPRFAISLIEKGASIALHNPTKSLLHLAMEGHHIQMAEALIARGADINQQNFYRRTPLHSLFDNKIGLEAVKEGVGLMLYHGADTSICDFNGNLPFDLAVLYDSDLEMEQWNLFFTTFDRDNKHDLSLEILFELLERESPLFFEISDYIQDVTFPKGVCLSLMFLFKAKKEFLRVLIDKFDYVLEELLEDAYIGEFTPIQYDNWVMLLESHLCDSILAFIGTLRINTLIEQMKDQGSSNDEIIQFIYFLLSYGLQVYQLDLEYVFKAFGYCDLFKLLLHMDHRISPCDIIPRIIFDMSCNLDVFLQDPDGYSLVAIRQLLGFFAKPKLQEFCKSFNSEQVNAKLESMPKVPLLVELARDVTRQYFIDEFKLTNSRRFYTFMKKLPINAIYKKIISFEKKLYY